MNDVETNEIDMDEAEAAGLIQNAGQGNGNQGMNNQEEEKK